MDRIGVLCALGLGLVFGMAIEQKHGVLRKIDAKLKEPAEKPQACKCPGCDEMSCGLPDCDECEADRAIARN